MRRIITYILIIIPTFLKSQSVGINATGATPSASAILDIVSTDKGFLIPRMTSAEKLAINGGSPPDGLIIFQTDGAKGLWYYDAATTWTQLAPVTSTLWDITGNTLTGTLPATPNEWLGSINAADLILKTNNIERMRVQSGGNVGIGTSTPGSKLDVKGEFRIAGATSGYFGMAVAAAAGSTTYTIPGTDGTNGQTFITDGAGTIRWDIQNHYTGTSNSESVADLFDDFLGEQDDGNVGGYSLGWRNFFSSGGSSNRSGSGLNKYGSVALQTVSGAHANLYLGSPTGVDYVYSNQGNLSVTYGIQETNKSGAAGSTNDFSTRIGLCSGNEFCQGADPTNGIYFRTVADGNYFAVTRSGGTETATNTGVSPSAGTWRQLKIVTNSAGNSIGFYINGSLVATHTTNIPSVLCDIGIEIDGGAANTTTSVLTIDYFYLLITGLNR